VADSYSATTAALLHHSPRLDRQDQAPPGRLTVVNAAGRTLKGNVATQVGLLAARGLLQLWLYDTPAL
jgi:hypothetical protein